MQNTFFFVLDSRNCHWNSTQRSRNSQTEFPASRLSSNLHYAVLGAQLV